MLITITGASGFIGKALCGSLKGSGYHVNGCCRTLNKVSSEVCLNKYESSDTNRGQTQWIL